MSALYGRLRGYTGDLSPAQRRDLTAQGEGTVLAVLENWESAIHVELRRDGTYTVQTGPKRGNPNRLICEGQISGGIDD